MNEIEKEVEDLAKSLAYNVAVKLAVADILAVLPGFLLPLSFILNPILALFIGYVGKSIYKYVVVLINFIAIDFKTQEQADDYNKALKQLSVAHSEGNANDLQAATISYNNALTNLVQSHRPNP